MPGQPDCRAPCPPPNPRHSHMASIESLNPDIPLFARTGINLASAVLGAKALWATNQFFAPLRPDARTTSRRSSSRASSTTTASGWTAGDAAPPRRRHDAAIIKLAGAGRIIGFDVDTAHFTGNYAPAVKIEATSYRGDLPPDEQSWVTILPHKALGPSAHHYFKM